VIISRRLKGVGHVVHMEENRGIYSVLVRKLRERGHLGDPGLDGRIVLRWIFRKWDMRAWTGLI
jgi:hypothetical protein